MKILSCIFIFIFGFFAGGFALSFAFRKNRRVRAFLNWKKNEKKGSSLATQQRLSGGPSLVAVGGGTGLSSLLMGLKAYTRNIIALVTVTDEGGSSGRLVRDWGVLPPGDIRNCLVALSENDSRLRSFLDFRFDRGDLKGHSLGNLMLLAATEQSGDFKEAVDLMNDLLAIRGRVLPISTETVTLVADTKSGRILRGELAVASCGREIERIRLEPAGVAPVDEALVAVSSADMIILGPGSLFTSVIPNLLVEEFTEELRNCHKPIIYVANLMSQPGETQGMTQLEHIVWIAKALGKYPDGVVVNEDLIPEPLLGPYRKLGAEPLFLSRDDENFLKSHNCAVYRASLLRIVGGSVVRHNSARLAEVLMRIHRKIYV